MKSKSLEVDGRGDFRGWEMRSSGREMGKTFRLCRLFRLWRGTFLKLPYFREMAVELRG